MDIDLRFELPHWLYWGGLLLFPLFYMVVVRWRERVAADPPHAPTMAELTEELHEAQQVHAPGNRFTRLADKLSEFSGAFVAYWTVIAVVVYFYEVLARYIFNSPTNWAHESMFLMFGMQYILAGAYAYLHDAHVRVDLFYARVGDRGKAAIDIITHFFFLVFALAFIWTAWTFFSTSMNSQVWFWATGYSDEVSFTEWGIAYFPVKFTLVLGGILLLIQGISRLVKDIEVLRLHGEDKSYG